ncbi:MAG: PHP domain-containing protein [Bacteroidia bacterium]
MYTNKEIAKILRLHGQLLELHGEDVFKYRTYQSASFKISKLDKPLAEMTVEQLNKIDGIGTALSNKIYQLVTEGSFNEFNKFTEKTPSGIIEILKIKGMGPKKIGVLWKELEIEPPGELLYACNENRLLDLKGFGKKTQDQIIHAIEYSILNKGKFLYATAENIAIQLLNDLRSEGIGKNISLTGEIRRKSIVLEKIEILIATENQDEVIDFIKSNPLIHPTTEIVNEDNVLKFETINGLKTEFFICNPDEFYYQLIITTGNTAHIESLNLKGLEKSFSEKEIYKYNKSSYVEPEMREGLGEVELAKSNKIPVLISEEDIKGIIHNHSTYSDGVNTLEEMATYCKDKGYEYFAICDHSKSAFYANGLSIERIILQQKEIDKLNIILSPFKILKGIESDILNDGSLDYPDEILSTFDLVVASIHSNFKMDKEKATNRLLKAIENPYTTILGHPTGRLLLAREGYPVDHQKIIDACAANGVVMELNANPYRLDMDWKWIGYALSKGVMISINPDAHSIEGIHDLHYGLCVARKGGLTGQMTFNTLSLYELENYLSIKKNKTQLSI